MNKSALSSLLLTITILTTACGGSASAPPPAAAGAPSAGNLTPQKGGEMTVVYKDDLATLDPAIGYDWTNWPAIKMVFDGLLDYDSGTNIQPRIAEALAKCECRWTCLHI